MAKVKLIRAIFIGGKAKKVGSVIDVPESLARELIQINKAERTTAAQDKEDKPKADPKLDPIPDPEKEPEADKDKEPNQTPVKEQKPKK